MKKKLFFYISMVLTVLGIFISTGRAEPIKVVASTLDMADFTKQIGGDKVEVYAISQGQFDLHFFQPKPRQVTKLHKADMLVVGGLGVDPWITGLIDASRNPKINYGGIGFVDPSMGVKALNKPTTQITGAMGDVHPFGNPHFWYTPQNISIALDNILKGLIRLSPENENFFKERKNQYIEKVEDTFTGLKQKMLPFSGTKVLQFHSSWDYFCIYFGLDLVGSVEPKPGLPPTPSHLQKLVTQIKKEQIKLILVEPFYSEKAPKFLEKNTKVKALKLPFYLGGKPEITNFLDNLTYIVNQIIQNLATNNLG